MKANSIFQTFLLTLVLSAIAQPAFAHRKLEPRINELEAQIQRLQLLVDGQGLQEMYLRLQALESENRSLRGGIEQLTYQNQQMKKRQRELYLEIDKRMQEMQTQQTAVGAMPTEGGEYTEALAEGEEAQYRQAFNLLKEKRYQESVAGFEAFLGAFPESTLAPNAQYWMAEANYAAGRYQQAVKAFDKVRAEYPSSPKVPDATLKLGFSYAALGKKTSARSVLSEVVQRYPGSSAAKLAQDRLNKLK